MFMKLAKKIMKHDCLRNTYDGDTWFHIAYNPDRIMFKNKKR